MFALLAIEGFLLLSEELGWFGFREDRGSPLVIGLAAVIVSWLLMSFWTHPSFKQHRYCPTPDRLILALLVIEGVLWLWDRLGCFPKGWMVLTVVGTVGLSMLVMFLWFAASLLFRWRFQFSLRSLLVLVLVVAIPCSWLAEEMRHGVVEAMEIKTLGGQVEYDYELQDFGNPSARADPPGPAWLSNLLGVNPFATVVRVRLESASVTDASLKHLKGLTQLQALSLAGTKVTDTGLEHLRGLTELKALNLVGTQVTDAGLEHLRGLTRLQSLYLASTQVTGAGLEHLKGLAKLQVLDLSRTKGTDAGLEHLEGLTQLQDLYLNGTQVTDAGLEQLKGLTQLQTLELNGTNVTDAGLEHLKGLTKLYDLSLSGTKVTDAGFSEHLRGLTHLRYLYLNRTKVTDEGVQVLHWVFPQCQISYWYDSR